MNAIETGMKFFQEIETVRRNSNGMWNWSKVLDGVSSSDVSIICRIAGCWCDYPCGTVKFYTNQNHMDHRF